MSYLTHYFPWLDSIVLFYYDIFINNIGLIISGIALLMAAVGIVVVYRNVHNKKLDAKYLSEILSRDQQIKTLQARVDNLNKLNENYLNFMLKVPLVVQRMNATLKFDEMFSSLIHLISEIIPTDKVDLYIFDMSHNLLKQVLHPGQQTPEKQVSYALGEGLIGMAAQDRMVRVRNHVGNVTPAKKDTQQADIQLWIAAPIIFRGSLLGVIGIGQVKKPLGNELSLIKMIADIAAVALINQSVIEEATEKANTDSLTGLNNRHYFFLVAQKFVEKSLRENIPISIFIFDIDNFKHYNDMNGHNEGDRLLKELSRLLRKSSRKSSVIARYGGEEFIVMLPGISKEDASVYAERLREKISVHPFPHRGKQPLGCVSISGGIASFPVDGDSIQKVLQFADVALYKAKAGGGTAL